MAYKLKSHRGAAKRFKKTASGGFKRKQAHLRHILTKKTVSYTHLTLPTTERV